MEEVVVLELSAIELSIIYSALQNTGAKGEETLRALLGVIVKIREARDSLASKALGQNGE